MQEMTVSRGGQTPRYRYWVVAVHSMRKTSYENATAIGSATPSCPGPIVPPQRTRRWGEVVANARCERGPTPDTIRCFLTSTGNKQNKQPVLPQLSQAICTLGVLINYIEVLSRSSSSSLLVNCLRQARQICLWTVWSIDSRPFPASGMTLKTT